MIGMLSAHNGIYSVFKYLIFSWKVKSVKSIRLQKYLFEVRPSNLVFVFDIFEANILTL